MLGSEICALLECAFLYKAEINVCIVDVICVYDILPIKSLLQLQDSWVLRLWIHTTFTHRHANMSQSDDVQLLVRVHSNALGPLTTSCAFLCSSRTCAVCCWIMSSSCCRSICCCERSCSCAACCSELPAPYTPDHIGAPRSSTSPPVERRGTRGETPTLERRIYDISRNEDRISLNPRGTADINLLLQRLPSVFVRRISQQPFRSTTPSSTPLIWL